MVFYFSGTGNSEFVATTIANFFSCKKYFIPETDFDHIDETDERIIFVFPVYSWGVPPLVSDFVNKMPATFRDNINNKNLPVDCILVCGDEVALAPEMFIKDLKRVGLSLSSCQSVIMPNNYVILPGFDVDSKEIENNKLDKCTGRILEIAEKLSQNFEGIDVVRGSIPAIKTKIVFPLFKRWGIFPQKWHYESNCISCGKCERICPLKNVNMENGHPHWGNRCCSCLACYHICPVHAVEYGKETKRKGQYFFPLKKS